MNDHPTDAILDASEVKDHFSDALGRVVEGKHRVIIRRRRKPVAALVPIEDFRLLEALEEEIDAQDALAALDEWERSGRKSSRPLADVARNLGVKL